MTYDTYVISELVHNDWYNKCDPSTRCHSMDGFDSVMIQYPTGRKFSLEFKLQYFANGKFAKFNSPYNYIFRNLS